MVAELDRDHVTSPRPLESGPAPTRTGWILVLGALVGATGLALAWGPSIAPELTPIIEGCAKNGVSPGLLLASGLVIGIVGIATRALARAQREAAERAQSEPEITPRIEQLATDLTQVRGAMQDLRVEFVYAKDGLQGLQQSLHEHLGTANPQGLQDAIFHMAGSLDQMGARLDERLSLQHDTFHQALQAFNTSLLTACLRIDELHGRMSYTEGVEIGAPEIGSGYGATGQIGSLGVLDQLDDIAPIQTQAPLRQVPLRDSKPSEMPRGPLPNHSPMDESLASKLAHLQVLMADVNVRQALSEMQRSGAM